MLGNQKEKKTFIREEIYTLLMPNFLKIYFTIHKDLIRLANLQTQYIILMKLPISRFQKVQWVQQQKSGEAL